LLENLKWRLLCFSQLYQKAIIEVNKSSYNKFTSAVTMSPLKMMPDTDISHIIIEDASPFLVDIFLE
jgi:predicted adenine nucleotide alpha hydrolase (AANH) superfamily ATPase